MLEPRAAAVVLYAAARNAGTLRSSIYVAAVALTPEVERVVKTAFGKGQSNLRAALADGLPTVLTLGLLTGATIGLRKTKAPAGLRFSLDGAPSTWLADHVKEVAQQIVDADLELTDERARSIASNEAFTSVMRGQRFAWLQAMGAKASLRNAAQGRTEAGQFTTDELRRVWVTQSDACPLCDDYEGETAAMDEDYHDGVYGPPLHPNCQCEEDLVE